MRTRDLAGRSSGLRARRREQWREFALIFPILVMLLAGITTAGLSYTHAIGLTNAVREGARFGATADTSSGTWAADVASRVRRTQFDDSATAASSGTSICVDLLMWSGTAWVASTVPGTSTCSNPAAAPSLGSSAAPAAPTSTTVGLCVAGMGGAEVRNLPHRRPDLARHRNTPVGRAI